MSLFPTGNYNIVQRAIMEAAENAMNGVAIGLQLDCEMFPPSLIVMSALPENKEKPLKALSVADLFVPGMEGFTATGLRMKLTNERAMFYVLIMEGWTLPKETILAMTPEQRMASFKDNPDRISCINAICESVYGDRAFLSYAIDEENGRKIDVTNPIEADCWVDDDARGIKPKGTLGQLLPRFPRPDALRGQVH